MFKKATFGTLGLLLVGGLLFGSRLVPYTKTAWHNVRTTAQDKVPVTFQIDAARSQLEQINPEIKDMIWKIAKEKADLKRLENELQAQADGLTKSRDQMLTLRKHIESGDKFYVATNGKAYASKRVEEDLRHRFTLHQTAQQTLDKSTQILDLRKQSLDTALSRLDSAKAQQRELEIQIENLTARQRMVEVASTASNLKIDNSQLAQTSQMIDDISARIDADEEMLNLVPKYLGQIPVGAEEVAAETDILEEMDAYFKTESKTENPDNVKVSVEINDVVVSKN